MKKHSKVGNRSGKPAYRTASSMRNKQLASLDKIIKKPKSGKNKKK